MQIPRFCSIGLTAVLFALTTSPITASPLLHRRNSTCQRTRVAILYAGSSFLFAFLLQAFDTGSCLLTMPFFPSHSVEPGLLASLLP